MSEMEEEAVVAKDPLEVLPIVMARTSRRSIQTKSRWDWLNYKTGFLLLILLDIAVRSVVAVYEIMFVQHNATYNPGLSPMFESELWSKERILYRNLVIIRLARLWLDDAVLFTFVQVNGLFSAWSAFKTLGACLFGNRKSKLAVVLKSMLFFNFFIVGWLLKEYAFDAMFAPIRRWLSYETSSWPHLRYGSLLVRLIGGNVVLAAFLSFWEWCGDLRFFAEALSGTYFLGQFTFLMTEPLSVFLRVVYGAALKPIKPDTHLYDLLLGISATTGMPMSNIYFLAAPLRRVIYAVGYKTNSAVIISEGLISHLKEVAYAVASAFPETSGPDDEDQMLLAAVTHDIGHLMTGQTLFYDCFGYGILISAFVWATIRYSLQKPILYRCFGFRHKPIPIVCALIILMMILATVKSTFGIALINAVNWAREAEADSYAAMNGFGPALHRFLYAIEAAYFTLARPTSVPYALFHSTHPPYKLRVKWLFS